MITSITTAFWAMMAKIGNIIETLKTDYTKGDE